MRFYVAVSITKILRIQQVLEATTRIGFPSRTIAGIGVVMLIATILYSLPKTSILGGILLTAHLGGATAANVRVGNSLFNTAFPIVFGILLWLGLYLRESRLRALIPLANATLKNLRLSIFYKHNLLIWQSSHPLGQPL